MTAFGTIILPTDIETAVLTVFKTWIDTYLREFERLTGRAGNALPKIASWAVMSSAEEKLPEHALPGVQLSWADMNLARHGDSMSAEIPFSVEVMVQSTDFDAVRKLAGLYGYAVVLVIVEKMRQGSPLISSITTPQLSIPVVASPETRRWRAVANVDFTVMSDKIADLMTSPDVPYPDPTPVPPDTPTVNEGEVLVNTALSLP